MLRRLGPYFVAMFPPWVMLPMAALHFLAIELGVQALAGASPLVVSWRSLAGTLGVFLLSLTLRVQDELKDLETDEALAAAGDPKYAQRALVTGAVLPSDLAAVRWLSLAVTAALSALLGEAALAAFAIVGALVVASYHWFFVPSMKKNLLLAFATHNPLSAAISSWCVAACVPEVSGVSRWTALLVVGLWMPVAAWEVGRKVRVPAEETAYETYSKILGARVAGALPAVFIALSAAMLGGAAWFAGVPAAYFALLAAAALFPIGKSLLFVLAPTSARANLRPSTELYAGVAGLGLIVALAARHGVRA